MGKRIHYLDNLRTFLVFAGICFAALGNFRPFPLLHPMFPAPMHSIEGLAIDFPVVSHQPSHRAGNLFYQRLFRRVFAAHPHDPALFQEQVDPSRLSLAGRYNSPGAGAPVPCQPELRQSRRRPGVLDRPPAVLVCLFPKPLLLYRAAHALSSALMGAKKWRRSLFQRAAAAPPSAGILAGFYALQLVVAAAFFGLLLAAHRTPDLWFPLYVLYLAAMSGLYFCFGVYAFRHRWFTAGGYVPSAVHIIGAALLLGVIVASSYITMGISVFISGTLFPLLLFFSILQLPLLLALLAAFQMGDMKRTRTRRRQLLLSAVRRQRHADSEHGLFSPASVPRRAVEMHPDAGLIVPLWVYDMPIRPASSALLQNALTLADSCVLRR